MALNRGHGPCCVLPETGEVSPTLKQPCLAVDTSGRRNHQGSYTACQSVDLLSNYPVVSSR